MVFVLFTDDWIIWRDLVVVFALLLSELFEKIWCGGIYFTSACAVWRDPVVTFDFITTTHIVLRVKDSTGGLTTQVTWMTGDMKSMYDQWPLPTLF